MSGHSKWASIKHKKAATDAKKGAAFTKTIKALTVAAKHGGGNPDSNPSLRLAIQKAKEVNMPADNIERAIKKGTGELPGVTYEEVTYEAYGPGGTAIIIEALTDNRNRTTSELRTVLSKKNGNMAGSGSVAWLFEKKGYFVVNKSVIDEDKLMGIVLEAGAEDLKGEETTYAVTCAPQDFEKVKGALEAQGVKFESAEISMVPKNTIRLTGNDAKRVLELVDAIEEHEDVQNVYANFDIPDEILSQLEK